MKPHWLDRPGLARRVRLALGLLLAAALLAQLFVVIEPHFAPERWFGFSALLGFLACAAMVLLARLAGAILKRGDGYYDDERG